MTDLSVDIESMGTAPGSAVVGIGACFFDAAGGQIGDAFYQAVNLASCVQAGLTMDPGTVVWWLQQSDQARMAIVASTARIETALAEFSEWVHARCPRDAVRPWMRGPSFDGALLTVAYERVGIELPWFFWNERCHRTLTARNPSVEPPERQGTYHNAKDDAIHQARWLIAIAEHHRAHSAR
jgi:exodeoxyribonuclease VIII